VISRGRRLDDGRGALGLDSRQQDARLHLGAGDRKRVLDAAQRLSRDAERKVPVGRLDRRPHRAQRLGDSLHRPSREGRVARQRELVSRLPGKDPGNQAHERARVRAVERRARRDEAADPLAEDAQGLGAVLVDLDPERPHRGDRRLGVRRASEAGDPGLAVADRAEEHGPVRDRLVPGHLEVPDEPRDALDEE
jgi:hypothetical protein